VVRAGDKKLYIAGGQRLDKEFLASLVLPAGMRALLYQNVGAVMQRPGPNAGRPYNNGTAAPSVVDASGPIPYPEKLMPLISRVENLSGELSSTITWTDDPASAETFQVIPLTGHNQEILGMFLVGSSRRDQIELEQHIRTVALIVGAAGTLLGSQSASQSPSGNWLSRRNRWRKETGACALRRRQVTSLANWRALSTR